MAFFSAYYKKKLRELIAGGLGGGSPETGDSIRSKLGITTLSGSNTGDETQSSILEKIDDGLTDENFSEDSIEDFEPEDVDLTLFATKTGAETLTNKRINPRVQTVASAATVTPNADTDDGVKITAQATGLTLANPAGTPEAMQTMVIRIKDNGTARSITYGTQYRAIGITLPTTTVLSKTLYLGMIYNIEDTKWDVTGYSLQA